MTHPSRFSLAYLWAAILVSSASALQAQTTVYQWNPAASSTGFSDGVGTWDASTKVDWSAVGASPVTTTTWGNQTNDIAQFGQNSTTGIGAITLVTLNSNVNAGGINFDAFDTASGQSAGSGYKIASASGHVYTITGPTSGTFTLNFSQAGFFTSNSLVGIAFTGASTYQFVGASNVGLGAGVSLASSGGTGGGRTTFDSNVVLGLAPGTAGSSTPDSGTLGIGNTSLLTSSSNTIQVNEAWTVYDNGFAESDNFKLNGLGNRGTGTLGIINGAASYTGSLQLLSDSTIMSGISPVGSVADVSNSVTGPISGSANITFGFFTQSATSTGLNKLVVGNTGSTNSGATVIINFKGGVNENATHYLQQRVALGADDGLSSSTTLVIGANGTKSAIGTAAALSSEGSGILAGDMIGVFDMNGHNLHVAGLATGSGLSTADAAANVIANSGGASFDGTNTTVGTGNVVLTVNGGSTGTQASTYAGILQDNFAGSGATADVGEKSTLGMAVTGGSQTLSGATNTYSGGTTVSGTGTLVVTNTSGSATGTGPVNVNAGGTLAGGTTASSKDNPGGATSRFFISGVTASNGINTSSGYIVGSGTNGVFINSGGHLAPGVAGIGTLTVGDLTLASGSEVDYEYDNSSSNINDFTMVNGALNLGSAITFDFDLVGTTNGVTTTGIYDLFSYTTLNGFNASDFVMGNAQSGLTYTFVNDTADGIIQLDITTAATPEPSTWAMLLGGIALLGFVIRRRSFQS